MPSVLTGSGSGSGSAWVLKGDGMGDLGWGAPLL